MDHPRSSTTTATAAWCVWDNDRRTRSTPSCAARAAALPLSCTSGRPSGARTTSISHQPLPRATSLPCRALHTASSAAGRTATWVAGSGRLSQYARSVGVSRRSKTREPLSAMIAATLETSTRSTPTPIAVTARGSEAEPCREPRGSGQVAAQDEAEPDERRGERGPDQDQGPERRPPSGDPLDL